MKHLSRINCELFKIAKERERKKNNNTMLITGQLVG